jgi:uncharacterized protein (TIGR02996 family)
MTTTDELTLIAAVCADPDDDTPRLVLADWLDEHGQTDRAEFVRLQVELATLEVATDSEVHNTGMCSPYCRDCPRLEELRRTEKRLWLPRPDDTGNYPPYSWLSELPGYTLTITPDESGEVAWYKDNGDGTPRIGGTVRRGFVESVQCSWNQWLEIERALCWWPGAVDVCELCEGGALRLYRGGTRRACPDCSGTGTAPRPVPPTAQPVREVVLTARPPSGRVTLFNATAATRDFVADGAAVARLKPGEWLEVRVAADEGLLAALEFTWPAAKFTLP